MASHKAPTAVTLAPVHEKSAFARAVERYWLGASVVAIIATAVILYSQYSQQAALQDADQSWERLLGVAKEDQFTRTLAGDRADLIGVADQVKGKDAEAWALYLAATSAAGKQDYAGAKAALERLKRDHPTHPLNTQTYPSEGADAPRSLTDQLAQRIDGQLAWRAANPGLFINPEPPADAPKVKITTDKGVVTVVLYPNLAPKHCENFLKLAREGFYKGTKFHRVIANFMIQGGDPNSREGDVATWGQGGPGYKLDREENNLKHFQGFLAAAKEGRDVQSSGSQFYITTADAHALDGQYVVFGKVLEGMDVVHTIEKQPLAAGSQDRPETPAVILSMEVL